VHLSETQVQIISWFYTPICLFLLLVECFIISRFVLYSASYLLHGVMF
jgi:hypothetical protein